MSDYHYRGYDENMNTQEADADDEVWRLVYLPGPYEDAGSMTAYLQSESSFATPNNPNRRDVLALHGSQPYDPQFLPSNAAPWDLPAATSTADESGENEASQDFNMTEVIPALNEECAAAIYFPGTIQTAVPMQLF
jgi:hypothetical protein